MCDFPFLYVAFNLVLSSILLVKKSIVSLLAKDLDKYMDDKIARKICYYLIGERDRRHFLPDVIKLLAIGDQTDTSKKPRETKELIESNIIANISSSFLEIYVKQLGKIRIHRGKIWRSFFDYLEDLNSLL